MLLVWDCKKKQNAKKPQASLYLSPTIISLCSLFFMNLFFVSCVLVFKQNIYLFFLLPRNYKENKIF